MTKQSVADKKQFFTPLFCRQIIWAIIDDGQAYFDNTLLPSNFIGSPEDIDFPILVLHELATNIYFQRPVIRASFPDAWLQMTPTPRPPTDYSSTQHITSDFLREWT